VVQVVEAVPRGRRANVGKRPLLVEADAWLVGGGLGGLQGRLGGVGSSESGLESGSEPVIGNGRAVGTLTFGICTLVFGTVRTCKSQPGDVSPK
jgi:hypothetical protein